MLVPVFSSEIPSPLPPPLNIKWVSQDQEDRKSFLHNYELATRSHNADAQFNLGYYYDEGCIVACNLEQAIYWYTLAAINGSSNAQFNLAQCYMIGRGVRPSVSQAACLFKLATEAGDLEASYRYANLLLMGEKVGVAKDEAEGLRLLREASSKGHAEAQNRLGLYLIRKGPETLNEGMEWLRQAAKNGAIWAEYNLKKLADESSDQAAKDIKEATP